MVVMSLLLILVIKSPILIPDLKAGETLFPLVAEKPTTISPLDMIFTPNGIPPAYNSIFDKSVALSLCT